MYKNYRFKIENTSKGTRLSISDYQPAWVVATEAALLIGTLIYGYVMLKPFM